MVLDLVDSRRGACSGSLTDMILIKLLTICFTRVKWGIAWQSYWRFTSFNNLVGWIWIELDISKSSHMSSEYVVQADGSVALSKLVEACQSCTN